MQRVDRDPRNDKFVPTGKFYDRSGRWAMLILGAFWPHGDIITDADLYRLEAETENLLDVPSDEDDHEPKLLTMYASDVSTPLWKASGGKCALTGLPIVLDQPYDDDETCVGIMLTKCETPIGPAGRRFPEPVQHVSLVRFYSFHEHQETTVNSMREALGVSGDDLAAAEKSFLAQAEVPAYAPMGYATY